MPSTTSSIAGAKTAFNWLQDGYDRSLDWSMRHKLRHSGAVRRSASAPRVVLFRCMPQDFLPRDDTGPAQRLDPGRQRHLLSSAWWPMASRSAKSSMPIPMSRARMLDVGSSGAGANGASTQHHAQAAGEPAQAAADQVGRGAAPQSATTCPASMSSSPIRRRSVSAARQSRSTYQYTLQGLDLAQLQDVADPAG